LRHHCWIETVRPVGGATKHWPPALNPRRVRRRFSPDAITVSGGASAAQAPTLSFLEARTSLGGRQSSLAIPLLSGAPSRCRGTPAPLETGARLDEASVHRNRKGADAGPAGN